MDHPRFFDLVERVLGLELGVRVVDRVLVVLPPNPGVVIGLGAVLVHMVAPALPNICGAPGDSSGSRRANIAMACLSRALVRSVYLTPSEPGSIFSKPIAIAQSAIPPRTAWRARKSAELPVEQLLFTLTTGIPVRPNW